MSSQTIESFARSIQVPYLLHFTRLANLPSIMQHGLWPIGRVNEINVFPEINDYHRFDGHTDATSLSIGFPNYRMFYKYRISDRSIDWVVLAIEPSILWVKKCAFCKFNAADSRISSQPLSELMTVRAFASMFDEIDDLPTRADQKLKLYDPTDVQAEILVFDVVEPQHIAGVVFQSNAAMNGNRHLTGSRKIVVNTNNGGFFASRSYVRN